MAYPQQAVIGAVRDHLEQTNIKYMSDGNVIRFSMSLESDLSTIDMLIICKPGHFIVYALCPLRANKKVRDKVMSFITYANYGLQRGNFEMDPSDGEIRYKALCTFDDEGPTPTEIIATISTPMLMMDRYGDGLIRVMFMGAAPMDAITECERTSGSRPRKE